jgi:hypothetical protein
MLSLSFSPFLPMCLGIPGCSWRGNLEVTEEGRAMAVRLLSQLSADQINDLFVASRCNLMRGDAISDWVAGFTEKFQRDLVNTTCASGTGPN